MRNTGVIKGKAVRYWHYYHNVRRQLYRVCYRS